jgi:hypothetical protein
MALLLDGFDCGMQSRRCFRPGMSTGYVMDFNNGTFASFVQTCIGFGPYQRYEGSKAVILRQIWLNEPFTEVAKLNLDLLSKWKLNKLRAGEEPTKYEQHALWRRSRSSSPQRSSRPSARTISPS